MSMASQDARVGDDEFGLETEIHLQIPGSGLSVPKASDVLANELRRQILDGSLPEGSALPVERVLAAESGLSRTSVREALRILEIDGLVQTKPGRAGGSFVRRPDLQSIDRTLGVFMAGRQVKFRSLLEVREALEPAGADLAARHRSSEDVDSLRRANELLESSVDDAGEFLRRNVEWHIAVVRASHNDLMHAFILSLSKAIHRGTDIEYFDSDEIRELTIVSHRKVTDAIAKQDPTRARRAMERHVHAYRVEVETQPTPEELNLVAGEE